MKIPEGEVETRLLGLTLGVPEVVDTPEGDPVKISVGETETRLLGLTVGDPVKNPEGEAETRLLGLTVGVDISETETIDVSEIDGEPD